MVVRRRGGSQDHIPGGSTENSRVPLRRRGRAPSPREGGQSHNALPEQAGQPPARAAKPRGKGDGSEAEGTQPVCPGETALGKFAQLQEPEIPPGSVGRTALSKEPGGRWCCWQDTRPRAAGTGRTGPSLEPTPAHRCCRSGTRVGTGELLQTHKRLLLCPGCRDLGAASASSPPRAISRCRHTRIRERLPPSPSPGSRAGFPLPARHTRCKRSSRGKGQSPGSCCPGASSIVEEQPNRCEFLWQPSWEAEPTPGRGGGAAPGGSGTDLPPPALP